MQTGDSLAARAVYGPLVVMVMKLEAKRVGTNNRFLDISDNSEGADVYLLVG